MYNSRSVRYRFACRGVLEYLRAELDFDACVLYRQDGSSEFVEFIAGYMPRVIEGKANDSLGHILKMVSTGQCANIIQDVSASPIRHITLFDNTMPMSVVAMPVVNRDIDFHGLLCGVSYTRKNQGLLSKRAIVEFCATQLEFIVGFRESNKQDEEHIAYLVDQAYRDAMTGLLNRNGWEEAIADILAQGVRVNQPMNVFVIDIDELKLLNDNKGHAAGDEAIRQVAVVLQHFFEPMDMVSIANQEPFVARIGGDEFISVQYGFDDEKAAHTVHAIKAELDRLGLSVSIGTSCCRSTKKLTQAIENADEAMYLQKSTSKSQNAA